MSKTTNYELEKYDDNTNCDFRFINDSLDKIDEELKNVNDKANKREIIIKGITIDKKKWSKTVFAGKTCYEYKHFDSDITEKDVVDINFSSSYVVSGATDGIYNITQSANGFVILFSESIPLVYGGTMIIQKAVA